ncbi:MAG: DUF1080 domain-containing protein [Candidatus Bathyarchaeota archaeon]|nr:DUF1080 domain-containing protein [Candidatus Bathyarchaeota archaeon]
MKAKTITTIMITLFLVSMLNVVVVGATSTVELIEWLPPLTKHEEFAFTDGSTLPIKFRLLDAAGSFVFDPTVEVTVTSIGDILFSDNFDDGNFDGWTPVLGDTSWSVTSTGVLYNNGTKSVPRILADSTMPFTDYIFEADARCWSRLGCALIFRAEDHNNLYSFQLDSGIIPPGGWRLRLSRFYDFTWPSEYYDVAPHVACPVPTGYGQWHHLKVEVVGNHIKCYIDGIKVFDVDDEVAPITTGGIGFRTFTWSKGEFDNVTVREIIEWESFSYGDGTIDVSESLYQCNLQTRELGMPAGDYMITVWLEGRSIQVESHAFELVAPGKGKGKA